MTKRWRVSWMLVVCPLLGLGCPKKSKGTSELPPAAPGPTAVAPAPAAPTPITTVQPTAMPATGATKTYCIGGAEADGSRSICEAQASKHPAWHRHGFVKSRQDGACYECWDEESNECEEKPPQLGYAYVGADVSGCGGAPMADPSRGMATP